MKNLRVRCAIQKHKRIQKQQDAMTIKKLIKQFTKVSTQDKINAMLARLPASASPALRAQVIRECSE